MQTRFLISFVSLLILISNLSLSQELNAVALTSNQLRFIPNQGQIADRAYSPRPDVKFKVEHKGLYLRDNGISFVLSNYNEVREKVDGKVQNYLTEHKDELVGDLSYELELWESQRIKVQQIDVDFLGCNENISVAQYGRSADYLNFYLAQCPEGVTNVPLYDYVVYSNVYDRVDARFYGDSRGDLKYDFEIQPYGDPGQIQLMWKGADSVYLNDLGELIITNKIENFKEIIPKVYQLIDGDTMIISAAYKLSYNVDLIPVVSYELGEYNPAHKLIIDPWVTNYGGEGEDWPHRITTDINGDITIIGATFSGVNIAESGFADVYAGGRDAFAAKFNPDGERIWGTYYGGSSEDQGLGVATDQLGNIYLSGGTTSTSAIAADGFLETFAGTIDGFLVKFAPDGSRIWATYYGGPGEDWSHNCGVDEYNNVYLTGYTWSFTGISFEGYQDVSGGFVDTYLIKFTPEGERLWGTYYGGINTEITNELDFDGEGHIYMAGVTTSPDNISSPGAYQEELGGGQDAYLLKFTLDGERVWATYFGELFIERGEAMVVDTLGDIYITGRTNSLSGLATAGAFQTESGGLSDTYLARFNSEGLLYWATYLGGNGTDYSFGIDVDKTSNNVVLFGETKSDDFPVSPCAPQPDLIGTRNAYVARFLPDGDLFCASYFGEYDEERSFGTVDGCYAYLTGKARSDISTPGAHQTFYGGGTMDTYLGKVHVSSCGLTIPETTYYSESQEDVTSCTPCDGSATITITDICVHPLALKSFVWSNGIEELNTTEMSSTIDGICEGEYWVEVTLSCNQIDTFYFSIGNYASITADFTSHNACVGDPINFENASSTAFGEIVNSDWQFGDGTSVGTTDASHIYDEPGIYEVELTVENDSECEDSLIVSVEVYPSYFIENNALVCENQSYTFPDGMTYLIVSDTVYEVNLESVYGCDSTVLTVIEMEPGYVFYEDVYVFEGEQVSFHDGTNQLAFVDFTYQSDLLSENMCDSSIITHVHVLEKEIPEPVEVSFKAPNIFTPGDQVNSTFYFPSIGVDQFSCVIVNQWGTTVFQFDSILDEWDGINQTTNLPCSDGVYFYIYEGAFVSGESFSGQGTVQLIWDK